MADEDIFSQYTCVDCGDRSPMPDADTPLISMQFGWRLVRGVSADGKVTADWRCPRCWRLFKEKQGEGASVRNTMPPAEPARAPRKV